MQYIRARIVFLLIVAFLRIVGPSFVPLPRQFANGVYARRLPRDADADDGAGGADDGADDDAGAALSADDNACGAHADDDNADDAVACGAQFVQLLDESYWIAAAWDLPSPALFATDATHGSVFHFAFTGATTLADNGGVSLANETATRDPRCIGYYYGDRLVDGFE